MDGGCTPADGKIRTFIKVVNTSTSPVDLAQVTIRYYYTDETKGNVKLADVYYTYGCATADVTKTFTALATPVAGADHYVQFGFAAGSLPANGGYAIVHADVHDSGWTLLDETNDYSYGAAAAYTTNGKITAWIGSTLAWGIEP
jgi:hypothetical protein